MPILIRGSSLSYCFTDHEIFPETKVILNLSHVFHDPLDTVIWEGTAQMAQCPNTNAATSLWTIYSRNYTESTSTEMLVNPKHLPRQTQVTPPQD